MRYLSVCSGIEAASVAWHHLGWEPVGFSEIEPFPAAVLAHRFPSVPNFGDMTKYEQWPLQPGSIDVLVGGTPCQSFSVAGLRKGLEDPRGNLMLTYLAIAARLRPRWIVWENVPGVLSSNGGRDFGTFLGALGELGYGFAYRVLDAQYVRVGGWPRAVPQRRRRVFVVGRLLERGAGDWTAAAQAVLIPEGLRRHNQASPKARKVAPSDAEGGARGGGNVSGTIAARFGQSRNNHEEYVVQAVAGTLGRALAKSRTEIDNHGAYIPVAQPVPFTKAKRAQSVTDDETWVQGQVNPTLSLFDQGDTRATTVAVAIGLTTYETPKFAHEVQPTLTVPSPSGGGQPPAVAHAMTVRRLSAEECEALQGFSRGWTRIPWRGKPAEQCPDGPRYKALGNSMACNCMAWIGEKIAKWEADHA